MDIKQKINQLPWRLILALGFIALVRPIIKIFGDVFGFIVSPLAVIVITAVIAIIWILVIIKLKVKRPIIVLAMSGVVYAVASITLAAIIQLAIPNLNDDEAKVPGLLTAALIAATAFNFAYGALLGLIASLIQKALHK